MRAILNMLFIVVLIYRNCDLELLFRNIFENLLIFIWSSFMFEFGINYSRFWMGFFNALFEWKRIEWKKTNLFRNQNLLSLTNPKIHFSSQFIIEKFYLQRLIEWFALTNLITIYLIEKQNYRFDSLFFSLSLEKLHRQSYFFLMSECLCVLLQIANILRIAYI